MRHLLLLALTLASLGLMGCPKRGETPPDYESTRRRAQESHDSMNREK